MNYSLSISKVWFVRSECTLCLLPLVDICFALPSPRAPGRDTTAETTTGGCGYSSNLLVFAIFYCCCFCFLWWTSGIFVKGSGLKLYKSSALRRFILIANWRGVCGLRRVHGRRVSRLKKAWYGGSVRRVRLFAIA